jgi:hypothetical protein
MSMLSPQLAVSLLEASRGAVGIEQEILLLIASGYTCQGIAARQHLAIASIETCVAILTSPMTAPTNGLTVADPGLIFVPHRRDLHCQLLDLSALGRGEAPRRRGWSVLASVNGGWRCRIVLGATSACFLGPQARRRD